MNDSMNRLRMVLAVCALALLVVVGNAGFPIPGARAQAGGNDPLVFKSAGPISLAHGESALIGLLLPAVQREAVIPFRLELFDGSGKMLTEVRIPAGARKTGFFNVSFVRSENGDGSVRVVNKTTGETVFEGKSDGILIALLLPAVQKNGNTINAISASIQLFNSDGQRGQVVAMCDGSV